MFKTPADNRTDYIKRLIGLPGDKLKFINGDLYLNNNIITKVRISKKDIVYCGSKNPIVIDTYEEKLPNNKKYNSVYFKEI